MDINVHPIDPRHCIGNEELHTTLMQMKCKLAKTEKKLNVSEGRLIN